MWDSDEWVEKKGKCHKNITPPEVWGDKVAPQDDLWQSPVAVLRSDKWCEKDKEEENCKRKEQVWGVPVKGIAMGFVVGLISVLLLLWDFIAYPIYFIWDRPWQETRWIDTNPGFKCWINFLKADRETKGKDSEQHEGRDHHWASANRIQDEGISTPGSFQSPILCRKSFKTHPRKSTRWRGFSNTRARYTRTGNAWVQDKFSASLKRNKKAGKCSQSFIWANIPGRRTPMSPLKQRVLERVFGNWAWRQRTRYFFDDTIPKRLHHHLTPLWHRWFYMQTHELSGWYLQLVLSSTAWPLWQSTQIWERTVFSMASLRFTFSFNKLFSYLVCFVWSSARYDELG